jgi:AraC-like DNA-binding protein
MEALRARGIDEWSAVCSRSFVPLLAEGEGSFSGLVRHISVHDIGVSYVESTSSRVYRPRALIQREPRDDVLLSIQVTGTGRVSQADRCVALVPGTGALYDSDRAYELSFPGTMSEIVLQIPRARLGVRDAILRDATARQLAATPRLIVLRHFLAGILAAGDGHEDDLGALADMAVELLAGALRPMLGMHDQALSGDALWHAACADIERRFVDPALTVDALARHHRVSRRHLEATFAKHDTSPAAHLRALRLAKSRELLTNTSATVASIAYATGFSEVNTFIRAFRRAYGETPDSWRRGLLTRTAG